MWGKFARFPFLLALQKPQDLSLSFQQVYDQLASPSATCQEISPTLRFNRVSEERDEKKPIAVYLPGLDGFGISAATQFSDLSHIFELWRLFIDPTDRSSFREIVNGASSFLSELHKNTSQPITLVGESCGGLFAAAIALKLSNTKVLQGLVMVNPATSFSRTAWETIVPQLVLVDDLIGKSRQETTDETDSNMSLEARENESVDELSNKSDWPSAYAILGSLLLSSTIPDTDQLRRIADSILSTPGTPSDIFETMVVAFKETERRLPSTLLNHRIEWLSVGTPIVNARINHLKLPTLVIVGKEDRLLPSEEEAERLVRIMPSAEKTVVQNRGHFVLDQNVNLTEAILYSSIDPLNWNQSKRKYDAITDWSLPEQSTIDSVIESFVKPLTSAHSPVWFSTDSKGKRWKGLLKVPQPKKNTSDGSNPILFVANHQLAGLDLSLILTEIWEQREYWPRGLAHPVTFLTGNGTSDELGGRTPGVMDQRAGIMPSNFQTFGAVEVNPRNYYRLMQSGQHVLLFPGGAKEAQSGRKDYPLFWPEKVDFVRTAAKFNATVVPLACIGMVDSVNVLAEPDAIMNMPLLGNRLRSFNTNISSARFDQRNEDEIIGFPLLIPGLPARNYFLFGQPFSLQDVDPYDKDACMNVYSQIQHELRRGLDDLLGAREHDAYKDTVRRLAYERLVGKQAPTFSADTLN